MKSVVILSEAKDLSLGRDPSRSFPWAKRMGSGWQTRWLKQWPLFLAGARLVRLRPMKLDALVGAQFIGAPPIYRPE